MAPERTVPSSSSTEARTGTIALRVPHGWARETPGDADLRVVRDPVVVTVRSRPSERAIADESKALLDRLPGSVHGVLIVGCDPWSSAGAPGCLVEYTRPDGIGVVFVSHLLLATGRQRVEILAERPLHALGATDAAVFAILDSIRVTESAAPIGDALDAPGLDAGATASAEPAVPPLGPRIDATAVVALQGMVGRRWNPAVLRSPGGRALIDAGLVGRFGTVPPATATLLAPWADEVLPLTLEQRVDGSHGSRLQAWIGDDVVTVLDGTDDTGFRLGSLRPEDLVTMLARRLGVAPEWTVPFATPSVPSTLLERRLATGAVGAALPAPVRDADPILARLWEAPWTVSSLRRPQRPRPLTVVRAEGAGFARVGRTGGGDTAFSIEAPANLFRLLVRAVIAA